MTYVISVIVIFFACTVGATVGLGGGVIIKPVLDSLNFCTVDIVNGKADKKHNENRLNDYHRARIAKACKSKIKQSVAEISAYYSTKRNKQRNLFVEFCLLNFVSHY